ncbi:hypothetical protein KI688_010393 [Linnemannia hyalina]|uniref:Uncharacterized protein n=1 Tax=Linnemannia hyalina TaxID=64524 RepID=A0A9P8BV66_9FUNG|nr:hypothetical protein KI688_010393 [Linnemannia hyalina]
MTPSYSSIHAASMDPSSVSVSVSVSASLPTPPTSFSGVRSDNNNNNNRSNGDNNYLESSETTSSGTNRRSNSADGIVAGSSFNFTSSNPDESRHQYQLAQPTTTTLPSSSSSTNNHNSNSNTTQSARLEVDDRIHFRLLDGIYFSAPPRSLRHDDDLGMDSPPHSQTRSDLQYIDIQDTNFSDQEDEYMHDNNAMEDLDFGESQPHHSMYDGQGDEFASVTFRRRSSHPELIEEEEEDEEPRQLNSRHRNILQHVDDDDEDDEDDGINEVMEGHRHSAALVRSPSSSLPSHFERPRHAQLSPRSAAALTSMITMGRSSWPPLISSSITSDLIAVSQPGARSEYDNNPYYRRPGASFHGQTDHGRQMGASNSSHSRQNSMPNHPMWQSSSSVPGNTFIPRSIPIQHNAVDRSTSSSHHQYGRRPLTDARGCGEVNYAPSLEARGDVWPLTFDMYYADGGEFNAAHSVENVLKNDTSVYCSRRSTNINICLKLSQPHLTFVLTQFKAKAPTTGFTAPCKEGLIFISHEPIQLEKTSLFDNMTRQMYDEYMGTVQHQSGFSRMYQSHGSDADSLIPAAFFQLGGPDETCTVDFSPNRSGRYVLIKLLRSRCTNSLQRPENIDLQYLGLIGFTGARSFASGGLL